MYEGNWKCSKCGGAITQLPFQPRSENGLTCRTCYAKGRDTAQADTASVPPQQNAEPMTDLPDFEHTSLADEPPLEDAFAGYEGIASAPAEKPKVEGTWSCAVCGSTITSLPFTPRNTDNLKCLDCFKAST